MENGARENEILELVRTSSSYDQRRHSIRSSVKTVLCVHLVSDTHLACMHVASYVSQTFYKDNCYSCSYSICSISLDRYKCEIVYFRICTKCILYSLCVCIFLYINIISISIINILIILLFKTRLAIF